MISLSAILQGIVIHPMFVHFPIAFLLIALVFYLYSSFSKNNNLHFYQQAAWVLLIIGTITAIPAYLSGLFLTEELTGKIGLLQDAHEKWAITTVVSALVSSLISTYLKMTGIQNRLSAIVLFLCYLITGCLVLVTAFTGGSIAH